MEKVQWRGLRRGSEVLKKLPVVLEYDGVNVGVLLPVEYYNQLVRGYRQNDDKVIPLYNPSIHKAGDTVRVLKGKREVTLTIPELDADGHPIDYSKEIKCC